VVAPLSASYSADRAASLAGVPRNTAYYWARTGLVVPSVSSERVKRWSFADVLVLRLIDWLRKDKPDADRDVPIPRTSVWVIRRELAKVESLAGRLEDESLTVFVDEAGRLRFDRDGQVVVELGLGFAQAVLESQVDLIAPSLWREGQRGPNLRSPRPTLRIVPGKLAGEPHVANTRIDTGTIASLVKRGFETGRIIELYPRLTAEAVADANELEEQLAENLRRHGVAA
jgi:uncharacterized protein (DUF433 family)